MQLLQFEVPHRCLVPGPVGSCIRPIHSQGLTNQAGDAVTNIGGRHAFGLPGEQGNVLQESVHQDQQDLPFRRKVLIKAAYSHPCGTRNLLNRSLLIALLSKERQSLLKQRLPFPSASLLLGSRKKLLPG
jgi:hypothetical protein